MSFLDHTVSCFWRTWVSLMPPSFVRHFHNPSGFVLTFPQTLTVFHRWYLYWHTTCSYSSVAHSGFSRCRSVSSRLCLGSVGIALSLSLWLPRFPPFWQIQVFPLLPEGRISVGVLARVEHAAGKTWYQRAGEDLERVRKHTSWASEKHNSSHIHHPTRAPLTSSFFTQRRTEHLSQAGFLSLWTCNPNSFIPFRASFS